MEISQSIAAFSDTTLSDAANGLTPDLLAKVVRIAVANDHVLARQIHGAVLSVAYENNEISINKRDIVNDPSKAPAVPRQVTTRVSVAKSTSAGAVSAKVETAARKAAKKDTATSPKAAKAKGEKRSPDAMAALMDKIATHVSENPGQGVEEIGRVFNSKTKELSRPIQKLIEANKITSKGQKRATRYFPAS